MAAARISAAILAALQREVQRRQLVLDAATDLHTVTITLKLVAGTEHVRGTVWQEERLSTPPSSRRP